MKYYVLLVTAFMATAILAQLSTDDLAIVRCDPLGERECGASTDVNQINCTWCPELSRCRAKTLGCDCKECPLALKSDKTCPDGSLLPQRCVTSKCFWQSGECPSGSGNATCTCSNSLQSGSRQCPDGTVVTPTCLVEKNCSWIYPTCPSCNGCAKSILPENSIKICPDGSSTKPICDDVKCEWFVPTCPSNESGSICPDRVPVVQCIISPCAAVKSSPFLNPEVVICKEDYCGGCNSRCYNLAGEEIKCTVEREIVNCSDETKCPTDKPKTDCLNAKVYCAPTVNIRESSTCNWYVYCPPTDPTPVVCGERSCGNNTVSSISLCRNGEKPQWSCEKVELNYATDTKSSVIAECSWVSKCPPIVEDVKRCTVGGACGDQCIDAKAPEVSILPVFDGSLCRRNLTCDQQCSISHRISGSCSHREGFGCQFSYQDGYYDCLKKCAGQPVEQPVCNGSACDCDYSKCYLCVLSLTLDSGRTLSKGVCASQTYGDACSAFGGSVVFSKPEKCLIIDQTGSNVPTEVAGVIVKTRDAVDPTKIQEKINQVIDSIPETKNLLISVTLTTEPQVTAEKEVSYDIVLSITGSSDLTVQQKLAICDKIVKPALESTVFGIDKRLICNIEKVRSGSVKRGLLSTSTSSYSANVVTAQSLPTNNNNNAAGTVVFSLLVAIVALLALIVY